MEVVKDISKVYEVAFVRCVISVIPLPISRSFEFRETSSHLFISLMFIISHNVRARVEVFFFFFSLLFSYILHVQNNIFYNHCKNKLVIRGYRNIYPSEIMRSINYENKNIFKIFIKRIAVQKKKKKF